MAKDVRPLPQEEFLRTFKLVPRVAVCVQVRGPSGEILLARRGKAMETMAGVWHYPGASLLLNETFAECLDRIVAKELGTTVEGTPVPLGFYENLDLDPRGHVIDTVFEVRLASDPATTAETEEVSFFSSIPDGIAFHHDRIMRASGLS